MTDGTVLRADVFRPGGGGRYPVIMTHGPYAKGLAFQEGFPAMWDNLVREHPDAVAGSTNRYLNWETVDPGKGVPDGYAVVRVDSRGAGNSQGYLDIFSPQETRDGSVALADRRGRETGWVTSSGRSSVFAGFRFPREVIAVAVRWYLRYGLSYRDAGELLAERGVAVDHVTIYRWVQRFTPEFIEAARYCRHAPGDRWFADETYVKVAGRWTYLYRAIDQHGQVIDVLLSARRDLAAARRFFTSALRAGTVPAEVTTDRAPVYPRVLDELIPSALHTVERYANNPVEADHGRLKARLRPMRGLKRQRSARIISAGHAFVQNIRRGHYELATDIPASYRICAAFDELAMSI